MQHGLPAPNDVIADKYTVVQALGRGGMGAVYVVSHRVTGKRLALKCLLPEYAHNADLVERFVREAQAMGRIEHRHVVDVFDVGRDGDVLYIVMELLDGKPLSDLLHDEQLTLEEALAILVRAMEGVAAAHVHGIVHRDLKPDNIFVCWGPSGRLDDPRVLDFGISKLDEGPGSSLTKSGVAMGTPCYMSLEQLSGNRDLDARVDVYAMGVILYEAIAGVPPHTADSVAALAIRVLTTPPTHLGELRPDLPAGLADVVMKAIARDRAERYPSIHALMDAIRPYVPRGAGLLVPEGQGRPLRTPRGAGASTPTAARSGARAAAAATATPAQLSASSAGAFHAGAGAPRAHGEAPTVTPAQLAAAPQGARPNAAAPRPAPQRASSPLAWAALGALGLLAVAGAGWFALARSGIAPAREQPTETRPSATEAPSAPALRSPEPALLAPAALAAHDDAGSEPLAQGAADAAALPIIPEPPATRDGVTTSPRTKHTRHAPRDKPGAATNNAQASEPPASTQAAKTAQGRAGKLGSDEF